MRGYGLTWNPIERVQAYTHPLWMILLLPLSLIQRDIYLNGIILSLALNFALFFTFVRRTKAGALLVAALFGAKCFQDYGISGLENPLLHFLLVLFITTALQKKLLSSVFLASFAYLTRQDSALITAPCLTYLAYNDWKKMGLKNTVKDIFVGAAPVFIWTAFSFVYYGFIFPNTAYAKLATGIPAAPLIEAGLNYLRNSLLWDPLTLVSIALSFCFLILRGRKEEKLIAAGVVLYLVYVTKVGGDYMSGRFFSAPFIVMVYLISPYIKLRDAAIISALFIAAAIINPRSFFSPRALPEKVFDKARIADSRRSFGPDTALITYINNGFSIKSRYYAKGVWMRNETRPVFRSKAIGMEGFAAGPRKTIIDIYGLSDPLLARLPVIDPTRWRVGHYARAVPEGYERAIVEGPVHLKNQRLVNYYSALYIITRAPVFSSERLKVLFRFHLGQYETSRRAYLGLSD